MNRFEEIKKLQAQLKAKILAIGKDGINDFFKPIFEANPELLQISWKQYTPYFNDGEACVFGVREPTVRVTGNEDGGDDEDGWLGSYSFTHFKGEDAKRKARVNALPKIDWDFQLPDEDILQQIFGDHTQITVSRDGTIEQDDYEHD